MWKKAPADLVVFIQERTLPRYRVCRKGISNGPDASLALDRLERFALPKARLLSSATVPADLNQFFGETEDDLVRFARNGKLIEVKHTMSVANATSSLVIA